MLNMGVWPGSSPAENNDVILCESNSSRLVISAVHQVAKEECAQEQHID